MKANEFIKKFGWDEAKAFLSFDSDVEIIYTASFFDDLKRLVESHELVGNFGGIKRAKRILKKSYTSFNTMVSVVWNDKPFQCTIEKLEKAITDVESCQ